MNFDDSDSAYIAGSDSDISDSDYNADRIMDFAGNAVISRPRRSQGFALQRPLSLSESFSSFTAFIATPSLNVKKQCIQ